MNKDQLREELDEITRIFFSAKYHELDFKYFYEQRFEYPNVYLTFQFLVERIFYASEVILIIDLCKLFGKSEKFSLLRLRNKIIENYSKSDLATYMPQKDLEELFIKIETDEIQGLILKLKTTRDQYYAHLDRTRTDFSKIQINSFETSELISIIETILKGLQLHYFQSDIDFNMDKYEIGHNLFERLNEWELYRSKYGLLNPE